jgi:hypothetical protein
VAPPRGSFHADAALEVRVGAPAALAAAAPPRAVAGARLRPPPEVRILDAGGNLVGTATEVRTGQT